ncbi:MAG: S16 family serine protease [Acidimicrobiales bacterium]
MSGIDESDHSPEQPGPLTVAGDSDRLVTADNEDARFESHRRLWIGLTSIACLTVASIVAAGFIIKPGYVALVPGSVRATEPLVVVDGTTTYPSSGEVFYTTVKLRQDISWWEYLVTKQNDDAELVEEEQILGDQTSDELEQQNLVMMTDSKDVAVAVALNKLGYHTISSDGVHIVEIVPGSSADGHLEVGDVVVAMDGVPTVAAIDLVNAIGDRRVGTEVVISVERGDDVIDIPITLGQRADGSPGAFLGVGPVDRIQIVDTAPFAVDIDSGTVGGPSAGLAFTLAILDSLTEGDLEGGHQVAVTGTISPTGAVGAIGGIMQKVAAVVDTDAEIFIVPLAQGEDELARVRERAGDDFQIFPVETLDEALDVLASFGGNVDSITNYEAS